MASGSASWEAGTSTTRGGFRHRLSTYEGRRASCARWLVQCSRETNGCSARNVSRGRSFFPRPTFRHFSTTLGSPNEAMVEDPEVLCTPRENIMFGTKQMQAPERAIQACLCHPLQKQTFHELGAKFGISEAYILPSVWKCASGHKPGDHTCGTILNAYGRCRSHH